MKRKVNRVGQNTLTVSLPSKWVKRIGVKAGDEVEVGEIQDNLVFNVSSKPLSTSLSTTIDISGLDSSSILHVIQAAYRSGYDIVRLNFSNETTYNPTRKKEDRVAKVIQKAVGRLIGFEIVDIKSEQIIIKHLSRNEPSEFENISRKTVYMFQELTKDMFDVLVNNNESLKKSVQEQHDNLTKFVSFCLRLMNKSGRFSNIKALTYHIYSNIDKLADIYKYLARNLVGKNVKLSKEEEKLLKDIQKNVLGFCDLALKFDLKKVADMSRRRGVVLQNMDSYMKKTKNAINVSIILRLESLLELIHDLNEAYIGLNLKREQS